MRKVVRDQLAITVFVRPEVDCLRCRWRVYVGTVSDESIVGEGPVTAEGVVETIPLAESQRGVRQAFLVVERPDNRGSYFLAATLPPETVRKVGWSSGVFAVLGIIVGGGVTFLSGYYLPLLSARRHEVARRLERRRVLYSEIEVGCEMLIGAPKGPEFNYALSPILRGEGVRDYLDSVENTEQLFGWLSTVGHACRSFGDDSRSLNEWQKQELQLRRVLAEVRRGG